jgi:hypothetical protein
MKEINELTGSIIGKAIDVHRQLGPGLLESTVTSLRQGLKRFINTPKGY